MIPKAATILCVSLLHNYGREKERLRHEATCIEKHEVSPSFPVAHSYTHGYLQKEKQNKYRAVEEKRMVNLSFPLA